MIDFDEATATLAAIVQALVGAVDAREGRNGADFRRAVGDLLALGEAAIAPGVAAPQLRTCFELALAAGVTFDRFERVRAATLALVVTDQAAIAIQQTAVMYCLSQQAVVVASTEFQSSDEATRLLDRANAGFDAAEEVAADEMDTWSSRAITSLHASVARDLTERGRLLPRLVGYKFVGPIPSLTMAQTIYSDGARADELRSQNRVVHPAFMPRIGTALSE